MIYVVNPGDTVTSIATRYSVSPDRLRYDNQLRANDTLIVGQALLILPVSTIHQVQSGETAYSIAERYGVTVRQLLQRNPFLALNVQPPAIIPLTSGEYLVIDYTEQTDEPTILEGYAYPFVRQNILREALPCLHSLYSFSYGFTPTGQLIEPLNADFLIDEAELFGVNPILVLTPMADDGSFNSNLVTILVNSPAVQQTLIDNLLSTALNMGYTGFDVDFEFISAKDRNGYTTFIARLTEQAHGVGLTVSVALPPKISADQPGLLYEGIDYGGLGSVVDQVLLMTYEWGYTYHHVSYR